MSGRLYYYPIESKSVGSCEMNLREILRKHIMNGNTDGKIYLSDIPFLEGVCAAGIEEAQELIDLLHRYDELRLEIEY